MDGAGVHQVQRALGPVRHLREALHGIAVKYEPHVQFKRRVPLAIGLIRTGDTIQYANIILESA